MSEDAKKDAATNPLVLIAGYCAAASVGIVAIVFLLIAMGRMQFSESGMWAIAVMAAAPSAMGVGIAYFICKQPRQDAPATKP